MPSRGSILALGTKDSEIPMKCVMECVISMKEPRRGVGAGGGSTVIKATLPHFPCTKTARYGLKVFGILDLVQKNVQSGEPGAVT